MPVKTLLETAKEEIRIFDRPAVATSKAMMIELESQQARIKELEIANDGLRLDIEAYKSANQLVVEQHQIDRERIKELEEELSNFVTQYGCDCGHPACSRCQDAKDARKALGGGE